MKPPIALQLYSVRDALAQDFVGTLKHVAALGYAGVEVFGAFESARETRQITGDLGLKVCGRHATFDPLVKNLQAEIEFALEVGAPYLICAWSKASERYGWPQIADTLQNMAETAARQGLKLAYHNHAHELTDHLDDTRALDVILAKPGLYAELDIAWLYAGGVNPAEYLSRYAGRTPLLHVKDVAREGENWVTVELGQGEVNLTDALATSRAEWLIVEQDHSPDPLGSAKRNLEYLRGLLG